MSYVPEATYDSAFKPAPVASSASSNLPPATAKAAAQAGVITPKMMPWLSPPEAISASASCFTPATLKTAAQVRVLTQEMVPLLYNDRIRALPENIDLQIVEELTDIELLEKFARIQQQENYH